MNRHFTELLSNKIPGLRLLLNEPMKLHTSFRIGGPAEAMAFPSSEAELEALLLFAEENGVPLVLLGAGTNVLAPDEGIRGLVVCTKDALTDITVSGNVITAQSGVTLAKAASAAYENGLTGLEFAHGIPGTVGGGVYMNAGAYGGELSQVVTEVSAVTGGVLRVFRGEELRFSYRESAFSGTGAVITRAVFRLSQGDAGQIKAKMQELSAKRRASQPLEYPSAGSTFKRPQGAYAAALIDAAGLKGFQIGGARVSDKHAGFVINAGGATARDVLALMEHIQKKVYDASGILLSPEVRIL